MLRRFIFAGSMLGLVWAARAAPWADSDSIQEPGPRYRVTRWTSEDGLPQNTARRLLQTRNGYLWVGTLYGLARFDGLHFKLFGQMNTAQMASDAIDAMAEDPGDGSLWIGTGEGLLHYAGHRFEHHSLGKSGSGAVGSLWPGRESGIWFQESLGRLARFLAGRISTWSWKAPHESAQLLFLEEQEDGAAIVLTGTGLYSFRPGAGMMERLGPPADHLLFLAASDPEGRIWLAGSQGLWLWDRKTWTQVAPVEAGSTGWPIRVLPARDGQVWVGLHGQGLHRVQGHRYVPVAEMSGPANADIMDLLEDREGSLWVGTGRGMFQLQPQRVRVFNQADGLAHENLQNVVSAPDGMLWLGGQEKITGLQHGKPAGIAPWPVGEAAPGSTMMVDRQGRLQVVSRGGALLTWDAGKWTPRPLPGPALALGNVQFLLEDREGRTWMGCRHGAVVEDQGVCTTFTTTNGLSLGDVRVVHQDQRGDVWFGTYGGGLNRLHEGRLTPFATTNGSYNNRSWWIHEDSDGVFWVASQNGLNRFVPPGSPAETNGLPGVSAPGETARFFTFTTRHGLHENVINNIQEDRFGHLWLSGLRGIYRVSRQQLNEVAAGRRGDVVCVVFGEADGMLTGECNGGEDQPSGARDSEGRIWFPTGRGALMVDPQSIETNETPPPVVIEQVIVDEEILYGDDVGSRERGAAGPGASPIALAAGRGRVLEVHYTANSFANPGRVQSIPPSPGQATGWIISSRGCKKSEGASRSVRFPARARR